MRRIAPLLILFALRPDPGAAHAFEGGSGIYDQFTQGVGVALTAPSIVLCLLPLGILVGGWRSDGMLAVWPWLLAGQAAGLFLAPLMPPETTAAALALGLVTGALAALKPDPPSPVPQGFAALTGLLATMSSFEGHALFELPLGVHAGLIFGANVAVAAPAALVASTLERWPRDWLSIGWRVAASWLAAICALVLAFAVKTMA